MSLRMPILAPQFFREAGMPTRLGGKNAILQTSQTEVGWHRFWERHAVRETQRPHKKEIIHKSY